jgi:hypothetical protein
MIGLEDGTVITTVDGTGMNIGALSMPGQPPTPDIRLGVGVRLGIVTITTTITTGTGAKPGVTTTGKPSLRAHQENLMARPPKKGWNPDLTGCAISFST